MIKHTLSLILAAVALATLSNVALAAAAPATGKVYELRIYTANAGKLADLQALFRSHGVRLLGKHGIENVFAGTVLEGAQSDGADAPNLLVFLLGHASREAADRSWEAFNAEADWQPAAPLLAKEPASTFMEATDFSPALASPTAAAGAPNRIFELRRYNTGAANLPYTAHRFKVGMADILAKAGMTPVAYWTATDRSAFIYMLAHKDREAARASWSAFLTDYRAFMVDYPKRPDAIPAAPRTPEENRFLVPADFSPRR